jgi:hypothetical protein
MKNTITLSENERLLVLSLQDRMSKRKMIDLLNGGRKLAGVPLIPTTYSFRMQIQPLDGYKGHPLDAFIRWKYRPSAEYPLSTDYIRSYGADYLVGYLDGYERLPYRSGRSESYVRAYVDGYKQQLREAHMSVAFFKQGKLRHMA